MRPGSNKARKEASKRLGLALHSNYRALIEASGDDEVQAAAIVLGGTFNTNIEFIINVLKHYGGMEVRFEPLTTRLQALPKPSNDLPDISALTGPAKAFGVPPVALPPCTCTPLEPGIIGPKHMASCPHAAG